ncbi:hypothetical protein Q428_01870 [Fervidicella metallireducens AeB]|uniref:UPF0735 ACT domain-containing protein Q428_01870 n=1 Tax=Fervidicella metallireducens AeB TaxID=1403537 RepID=A0A017RY35_9CLOT|nr:ACT domain-containing protein [Fervidicella metallireducens]EYE89552.1 hypothetical protein Q428_01870 [Fervidicella metallireducens AeB]
MVINNSKFYVVEASALPEVYIKVAEAKRLLITGECRTINEAAKRSGISRSSYYKYKDSIFEFHESKSNILTFMLILHHISGTLSRILEKIAECNANILTINQSIPQDDEAMVSISIDTISMNRSQEELLASIKHLKGVKALRLISHF